MSNSSRRQFLKGALTALVQVTGSVTVASAAVASTRSREDEKGKRSEDGEPPAGELQRRADELADARGPSPEAEGTAAQFLNFRNGGGFGGGGWRNGGGWPGGIWRNGGWNNFPWRNGWGNGGWGNLPWFNGGWGNGGWRNW